MYINIAEFELGLATKTRAASMDMINKKREN